MIGSLVKKLRARGIFGTLRAVRSYARNRYRLWRDASFDRTYGTDTQGIIDDMAELGVHSAQRAHAQGYEGVQIPVFRQLLRDLPIDSREYTFVDFGSGKGRALMMAAETGFAQVFGVEFSPLLHAIAQQNIERFQRRFLQRRQRPASPITLALQNAVDYPIPAGKLVCFFYNPFDRPVMQKVVDNIKVSYLNNPRDFIVAYRNPVQADLFDNLAFLRLAAATRDYRIYKTV